VARAGRAALVLTMLAPTILAPSGCRWTTTPGTSSTRDDGTLDVVLPQDVEQIDPRRVADAYGLKVSRLLFASLVTIDPRTLEVVPDLAERVVAETPTRYRVTLRAGLRFSDGSILDAEDVVATFRGLVDPRVGSRYAGTYRRITDIDAPDARNIVFTLDAPHAPFLTDLEMPVLRAEDARAPMPMPAGDVPEGAAPIGAGPYRLLRRRPGHLELVANPHWHGGVPYHTRIRMTVVRDDNTRALRLLAGEGDLALNAVPPLLVPLFERDARFRVRTAPGVGTTYLGVNQDALPLADVRVRRALAHAVDREALVRAKFGGRARLARGVVPPGHWAYADDARDYPYDPGRARALLDEAGVRDPDGDGPEPRLRFTLRTGPDRFRQSIARALAAMLRDVGIEVDVRPSEVATLIADLNAGRFDLCVLQLPEVFEPHVLTWFFGSAHVPGEGREGANRWRHRDPRLDAALERGRRATARAERREAYLEAQRLLAEQLPVIPLWHEDVVAILGPGAGEYDVPRDGRFATLAR
jgi:peptide/nickel transport system substrate-binding protein